MTSPSPSTDNPYAPPTTSAAAIPALERQLAAGSFARGAYAVLALFALFAVVGFVEALLNLAGAALLGTLGGGVAPLAVVMVTVAAAGLAARALLLIRTLRRGGRQQAAGSWARPILLLVCALLAGGATTLLTSVQTMLLARWFGTEAFGAHMLRVSFISVGVLICNGALLALGLFLAFRRWRAATAGADAAA